MKSLKSKGAIWFASSATQPGEVKKGIRNLEKLGLDFFISPTTRREISRKESQARPYLASTEKNKIKALGEIQRAIKKNTKLDLFMSRGGYGSIRLLGSLSPANWKFLAKSRIWGFSDLTTLQNALYFKFGSEWVHSPMLTSPAFYNPSKQDSQIWKNLCDSDFRSPFVYKLHGSKKFGSIKASGSADLIGGNLACFMALFGTDYHPQPKKPFFFMLEDVGEKPHRLDRYLSQLSLNKKFLSKCRGVLLGDFADCPGWKNVVFKWAQEKNIPLLWGLPVGHDRQNLPILMGAKVQLRQISDAVFELQVPNFHFGC